MRETCGDKYMRGIWCIRAGLREEKKGGDVRGRECSELKTVISICRESNHEAS